MLYLFLKIQVKTSLVVTVDTVVLLGVVGAISLPQVVESSKQNAGVTGLGLDGAHSSLLVAQRRNSNAVGVTAGRPAGLGDENILTTASRLDTLDLLDEPVTGTRGINVAIEESVGVDGNVVGESTETRVVDDSNESIDGDDGAGVAVSSKSGSGSANVTSNLVNGSSTHVDKLVTNRDGVDNTPSAVSLDSIVNGTTSRLDATHVKDTKEDLLTGSKGSENVRNLVAVNAVDSNHRVAGELGNISLDLISGLASTGLVGGVHNTLGTTGERARASSRRRSSRGSRSGSSSRRSGGRRSSSRGSSGRRSSGSRGRGVNVVGHVDGDSIRFGVTLVGVVQVDGLSGGQDGGHGHGRGDGKLSVEDHWKFTSTIGDLLCRRS